MNTVIITGNLGNDPETIFAKSGMTITKFSMAFSMPKNETGWIEVVSFEKVADTASKYLSKGDKVLVNGRLNYETWQDRETGANRSTLKLIASNIEFMKIKKNLKGNNSKSVKSRSKQSDSTQQQPLYDNNASCQEPDNTDDVPF